MPDIKRNILSRFSYVQKIKSDSNETMLKLLLFFSCRKEAKSISISIDLPVFYLGRRSGIMVSALDSGSSDPGSSFGWGTVLRSWAKHFTLLVALFSQVYKWVPTNLLLGVTRRWTSIPSRRE